MLKTERLTLRRARMTDLDDLHRVFSNPQAMRYWDCLPYQHIDQTRHLLTAIVTSDLATSDDFVIERQGRAIGKAGCWRMGEVAVILHPDFWGQGLAREALGAAIPHAFDALPIDRLIADVDPRNAASLALFTGLGFVETSRVERTIKVGEEWCDSVYLELPRPDRTDP